MKRLVLVLSCALWCAACGEDDAPEQQNPPKGWVYCNDAELPILSTTEEVNAVMAAKPGCNAVRLNLDISGFSDISLEGLSGLRHIQGTLFIMNSGVSDLTPILGLETANKVNISGNNALDNCQATALAYQLTGDHSLVKNNKGAAICTTFPK